MDLTARILELLAERGWSKYQLAKETHLSQSTISSLIIRGNTPTIPTIESCCKAFGITMAEFFNADLQDKELTLEERRLISDWRNLTPKAKQAVLQMVAASQPSKDKYVRKHNRNDRAVLLFAVWFLARARNVRPSMVRGFLVVVLRERRKIHV